MSGESVEKVSQHFTEAAEDVESHAHTLLLTMESLKLLPLAVGAV